MTDERSADTSGHAATPNGSRAALRPGRVLVVDDDPALPPLIAAVLAPHVVTAQSSPIEALASLQNGEFDVVVTDVQMPELNGIELSQRIAAAHPGLPVIVMTTHANVDNAVLAIRAGAYDFLAKPLHAPSLRVAVERALEHRRLTGEVEQLRRLVKSAQVDEGKAFEEIVGASAPMREIFRLLERVAVSPSSVLITGESGTGKEGIARAIHRRSNRRQGPMVTVNCAALPEPLLESELFGHAKGAFTDARESHTGLFAQANGGTLFLDEIGDMPIGLQPKLLRALQERKVRPVGSTKEVAIDVRIVVATNADLERAVEDKRFRADLYFRLNVIHIEVPPLRMRGGDVLLLGQHFLDEFASRAGKPVGRIGAAVARRLLAYSWPGNVRELQNCIERAVALASYDEIVEADLPERVRQQPQAIAQLPTAEEQVELVTIDELERRHIGRVLHATDGNKTEAARVLGLARKTLYRKLEQYGYEKAGSATGGD